jgi:hypothetical protein
MAHARVSVWSIAGCCAIVLFVGCGSSPDTVGGSNAGTGATGSGTFSIGGSSGGPSGNGGVSGGTTLPDGTCGSTTANTSRAQADILVLLDNTQSMRWGLTSDTDCNTANCSRQSVVVPAVNDVVANNPGINWGLELMIVPNNTGTCEVYKTPQVPVGANTAATIKSQLASVQLGLSTPTAASLQSATAYLKTVSDGNEKAILLATDGQPNCRSGADWSTEDLAGASAAAGEALKAGFPVYVVGIGPSVSNLSALAKAGGTNDYYPASSPAQLGTALASIAKVVSATCTFKANATPPDKTLVYVYVDKKLVDKGDSKGWKFDNADATGATITLTGSYCDDMMSGKTTQVQIVFGCPNVAPPSVIK